MTCAGCDELIVAIVVEAPNPVAAPMPVCAAPIPEGPDAPDGATGGPDSVPDDWPPVRCAVALGGTGGTAAVGCLEGLPVSGFSGS